MFEQPTATFDQRHRGFFNATDEPRQVWALDASTGQIVYLPQHAVGDSVRDACRTGRLRCPIAQCPDPRLIAKGGTQRRHHFAHKVAHTHHDSAAIFRTEAVAMLADWAQRYRGAQIGTRHDGSLGIVTIRSLTTGKVAELAVTYNPREDPTGAGRQLLIGHTRTLLLPRSEHPLVPGAWCCGSPRLVADLIGRTGAAIAVNPERRLVGTVLSTDLAERAGLTPKNTDNHPTICLIDDLDACQLDEHGTITTPTLQALRASQQPTGSISGARAPRRRRTDRDTAAPSPIDVERLPTVTTASHAGADINRVVLSGRLAPHRGGRWQLTLSARSAHAPPLQILVEPQPGRTLPVTEADAVIQGRLTGEPDDGHLLLLAEAVELYTPQSAGNRGS
jgi:hypothetical protein